MCTHNLTIFLKLLCTDQSIVSHVLTEEWAKLKKWPKYILFVVKQPNRATNKFEQSCIGIVGVLIRTACDLEHAHCECEMKGGFQDSSTSHSIAYSISFTIGVQLALLTWVTWEKKCLGAVKVF